MTEPAPHIVVGIADRTKNEGALAFATSEAARRGLPVRLVHCYEPYPRYSLSVGVPSMYGYADAVREAAEQVAQQASEQVQALAPDILATSEVIEGPTAPMLLEASKRATMVVLGTHSGRPSWLGPVIGHLSTGAECPVVCVPESASAAPGPVVVGIDGGTVSLRAAEFAFDQAERWGAPLTALLSVDSAYEPYMTAEGYVEELRRGGELELVESLSAVRTRYPGVAVELRVSLESPFLALRHASQDAALLVLGSHGRGALMRVVLGSVSGSILRAAPCRVAVVPPHGHDE